MNKPRLAKRSIIALGLEVLETRRLMHAGHEHDPAEPKVFELFGDLAEGEPQDPTAATFPLSSLPALSSLPGAAASLYLDFDGFFEANWGSFSNITTPAFDQDNDTSTFSTGELTTIENVWAQVSEDFAPFNINVTTVEPPSFANGAALRVAIGGTGSWAGGTYGGIAYVNSFTNSISNTVYVFPKNLSNGYYKYTAEASSHEAGHGFGLQHQSLYDANGVRISEYYSGASGRAPIMGNSYSATRGLWWYGTSTSAFTFQDDMAVISRPTNGFGYRADDHGNTAAAATSLSGSGPLTGSGIITTTSDVDYFSFDTGAGQVTLSVTVSLNVNNLDSRLELRTASGSLIASAAPANLFGASITTSLAAGSYTLVVASQGNYGDVGQYTLTATLPSPSSPAEVLARAIFYNQSAFDGTSAAIGAADDAAIAPDKVAYRPGDGMATAASVTSYTRGINGIMIDLAGDHGSLSAADFTFRTSGTGQSVNNSPGTWAAAPAPLDVALRAGAGTNNSDRVEIVWPAGAIVDRWLEVIFEGNDAAGGFNTNTGLAASDVFYFGNKIGDTFAVGGPGAFTTDALDQIQIRNNQGVALSLTNPFDLTRDALIDATDQIAARFNQGALLAINIATPPGAPEFDTGAEAAVASALPAPPPDAHPFATLLSAALPQSAESSPERVTADAPPQPAPDARARAFEAAIDELADAWIVDDDLLDRLAVRDPRDPLAPS